MKITIILCLLLGSCFCDISTKFSDNMDDISIDLAKELHKIFGSGNFVYSTISIETILALISQGAKGQTAEQIKTTIRFNTSDEEIRNFFKSFHQSVKNEKYATLQSANKLYVGKNFKIKQEFLDTAVGDFEAGVENVDFASSQETADKINAWVESQTNHKIKNLIKKSQINSDTCLALVNALYFRGRWTHKFNGDHTKKLDFHLSNNEKIQVDTMTLTNSFQVYESPKYGCRVIELPLLGGKAKFYILLPDTIDGLGTIEQNLHDMWKERNFTRQYVKLFLPKFQVESSVDFIPILKKHGITNLFSRADLSGIADGDLVVSAVAQKTFFKLNEEGVEGASATVGLVEKRVSFRPKQDPVEFRCDKPFFFHLAYEGVALISGRVKNPSI